MAHPGVPFGTFERNRVKYAVHVKFLLGGKIDRIYIASTTMSTWFTLAQYDATNKLHVNAIILVKQAVERLDEGAVLDDRVEQDWPDDPRLY